MRTNYVLFWNIVIIQTFLSLFILVIHPGFSQEIDRYALVNRHTSITSTPDTVHPYSVGNGRFAFTVDFTGLQTFVEHYQGISLTTMAIWGWHSYPNPHRWSLDKYLKKYPQTQNYSSIVDSAEPGKVEYLRNNPHRFNWYLDGRAHPNETPQAFPKTGGLCNMNR